MVATWTISVLLGLVMPRGSSPAQPIDEKAALAVKAQALLRFPLFIHWPDGAFPDEQTPIVVGVIGDEKVTAAVMKAARDQQGKGRPVEVRTSEPPDAIDREALAGCHVVYVADAAHGRLTDVVKQVADKPILIVSDVEDSIHHGSMIGLAIDGGRIAFDVGLKALQSAGLKADAKLLKLARLVDR